MDPPTLPAGQVGVCSAVLVIDGRRYEFRDVTRRAAVAHAARFRPDLAPAVWSWDGETWSLVTARTVGSARAPGA